MIISYKITPKDQMSVRVSTSLAERICSGDMYKGEPIKTEVRVSESSDALPPRSDFEMPKSSTFTMRVPSARSMARKCSDEWISSQTTRLLRSESDSRGRHALDWTDSQTGRVRGLARPR